MRIGACAHCVRGGFDAMCLRRSRLALLAVILRAVWFGENALAEEDFVMRIEQPIF
jgi:hypothetical protein